jgi:hypothetical protein
MCPTDVVGMPLCIFDKSMGAVHRNALRKHGVLTKLFIVKQFKSMLLMATESRINILEL